MNIVLTISIALGVYAFQPKFRPTNANGCPSPLLTLNGSSVVARRNATPDYSTLSEIKFTAQLPAPFKQFKDRLCKIKCVGGEWVGPLCRTEQNEDDGRFHPILRNCRLNLNGTNLVLVYDDTIFRNWIGWIPDRSKVTIRCDGEPGLYKFIGHSNLQCLNGDWDFEIPRCIATTSISAYSENVPPTIRVKLAYGTSAIDNVNNHIVIYPGSVVHLECLFRRKYGEVQWTWTTKQRNHLTGWAIAADEREWIYRMSLYYVRMEQDSGNYTCTTPKLQYNTVSLKIEAVQCEKRHHYERKPLISKGLGNHVGQIINYTCPYGFMLIGPNQSRCSANGKWSSGVPYCEPIVCEAVSVSDTRLIFSENNRTYGSIMKFRCAWGYALKGVDEIRCQINGRWSAAIPKCIDILCPPPSIPTNGYLLEESNGGTYHVGTIIQFACEKPYRLVGEQTIICKENGMWSNALPSCRTVCEYPGEPTNGRIVPLKFWYETGDRFKVICDDGYVTTMSVFASCTSNGTWSMQIPNCLNYTQV